MKENSRLMIIDTVLSDWEPIPIKKRFIDLQMMIMLTGKERSEKDFRTLLDGVGLQLNQIYESRTVYSIVQASLKSSKH